MARWGIALTCAGIPIFLAGMLDWYTWSQPFRSLWLNFFINTKLGVTFGGNPFGYYLHMLTLMWLWTIIFMAILIWRGAKLLPLSGVTALLIILSHSFIAHKEYRFIFPAIALFVPVAGVGLARLYAGMSQTNATSSLRFALLALLLTGPFFSPWLYYMLTAETASFRIFEHIKYQTSGLVAVHQPDYNFMPLDILFLQNTMVIPLTQSALAAQLPGAIVSSAARFMPPDHYHLDFCERQAANPFTLDQQGKICVWLDDNAINRPSPAPSVDFYVPDIARPFIIHDRLAN